MKVLNLIMSLLSKLGRRKRRTVSKAHTAQAKPNDAASSYRSGIEKFNSAEYHAAIEDFSHAISLRNNFPQAFYNRGLTKLKINDNHGAAHDFTKAIEIHPVYAKAYLNRGIAKNRLGDPEGAQEDFNQSVKIDPQLYPYFTVKKTPVTKVSGQNVSAENTDNNHAVNGNGIEALKTDLQEEAENQKASIAESEIGEEGFMKPLVLESGKDEFSLKSPVKEKEEEVITSGNSFFSESEPDSVKPAIQEKSGTEEYKFQELNSEDGQDEFSGKSFVSSDAEEEEKPLSISDDPASEESMDHSVKQEGTETEEELQSLRHKPEEAEDPSDEFDITIDPFKNFFNEEYPADDLKKYNFSETGISEEEVRKIFLSGKDDAEEEIELPEEIPGGEEASEKQRRREARVPKDPSEEEIMKDLEKYGKDFSIELPEQHEIPRILAESIAEIRKKYATGYYYRARLKHEEGDKAGAILDCSNAVEFFPKFSQAYLFRGNIQSELNELAEAVSDYTKAIEYHAKNPVAYYNRALVNQKLEKNREALADFTKAILFDPRNPKLYLFRGVLRYKMGQIRSAFADWSKAEMLGSGQAKELREKYTLKLKKELE